MLPTLGSVAAVVQQHSSAGALQQVGPLVSSFMGPSPTLSLSEACKLQSVVLLDWIWTSSCTSDGTRSPHWSLSNFLRSDKFYHRWQFAAALKVAVEKEDVALLKWVFSHFQSCVVTPDLVDLVAEQGNISVLQFLLANASQESEGNKVEWGGDSIQQALAKGKLDAAHWLYSNIPLEGMNRQQRTWTIKAAMDAGDLDFCKVMMPIGRCLLDYSEYCSTPEVVEWKLDCGYLKRDVFDAVVSIRDLVPTGRVDLMQRISDEHHELPGDSEWPGEWQDALNDACHAGKLPVVKWLVEHPVGHQTIDEMRFARNLFKLLSHSAAKGFVGVMQYLYEQNAADQFADALAKAIEMDQMEAVKWIVEHFPSTETIPDYCVLDEAARRGRVDMLELFQSLGPSGVPGFFPAPAPTSDGEGGEQDEPVHVIVAKADRHRKIKVPGSSKRFDVLLFLHARFPDLFTSDFIRSVRSLVTGRRANRSDVEILDWLTANYPVPDMPQGQDERFEGLAGQILGNIAQQIADQLDVQPAVEQQQIELQNNAVAMVMNNIMAVVHQGDEDDEDLADNA
ncbi:hypothetical protein KRP22_009890 [Phytophthora ramorum]|nr:hypothetical protein KRP22_10063 [Phytophthora ramorum]